MTVLSADDWEKGVRIAHGFSTEFNFELFKVEAAHMITENHLATAFGIGSYETKCDKKSNNQCEITIMMNATFFNAEDKPDTVFVDIADKHSSERLQCDTKSVCKQYVWKEANKKWITEEDYRKTAIDSAHPKGLPFRKITGQYLDQGFYTLSFTREFNADLASKWHLGETKEIMIGTFLPQTDQGKKQLAHSHKMEIRLGNEVWMADKHRKLSGELYL